MGARSNRLATPLALLLLVACNAMTGADALGIGAERDESDVIGGSSGTTDPASSDAGADAEPNPTAHRPASKKDGSAPPSQNDAGFDAATGAPPGFSDAFDRPNAGTIGNGWVAKTGGFFSLESGAVLQTGTGRYENLILSRPDIVLDVQASLDVVYGQHPDSDPTIHLRMLPASDKPGELVSYTFYAFRDYAGLDREDPGDVGVELAGVAISPELAIGKAYRMIFRVTGTNPVKLEATIVDVQTGAPAATLTTTDGSDKRITTGGKVGFGSGRADAMRFDNFVRVDL